MLSQEDHHEYKVTLYYSKFEASSGHRVKLRQRGGGRGGKDREINSHHRGTHRETETEREELEINV